MISINKKVLQRLNLISFGAVFQVFNAFSTALIAYIFFSNGNVIIWGQFAAIWLFITWFTLASNFGNKDFLFKAFSQQKIKHQQLCQESMSARFPILIFLIIILLFFLPIKQSLIIIPLLLASFITNSFQPLLIFERKFILLCGVEVLAILMQIVFIFIRIEQIQLKELLLSFLIYNLVKLIAISMIYKKGVVPEISFSIKVNMLKALWPFFLLGLGGMLVNKSDFMIVATNLSDISKAKYQILSTFSTMGIIAAHAVLQPFIKQIYRINWTVFNNIAFKYFLLGIPLSLLYCLVVFGITNYIFDFRLSFNSCVLLFFIELLFFAINPLVFYMFRNEKQQRFIFILLISGAFSLLIALLLVKPYGIVGALMANFSGNLLMFILLWNARYSLNKREIGNLKSGFKF